MFLPKTIFFAENQPKGQISGLDLWKSVITVQPILLKLQQPQAKAQTNTGSRFRQIPVPCQ